MDKIPICENECYVKINHGIQCSKSSPSGKFKCSRLPNHKGYHVACGVEHSLMVWDNDAITEKHLCESCRFNFAECPSKNIVWGIDRYPNARGKDADKVLECDAYLKEELNV
jgi:hypothetical protein